MTFYDTLQEEDQLGTFKKQLEEDRKIVISRSSLNELHAVRKKYFFSIFSVNDYVLSLHSYIAFEVWLPLMCFILLISDNDGWIFML